jgi:hypothetical protein
LLVPVVVFFALPCAAAAAEDAAAAAAAVPIWPIPREARYGDDRLLLHDAVIVVPSGDAREQSPGRLLAEMIADQLDVALPVVVETAPEGSIPIVVGPLSAPVVARAVRGSVPEAAEGYLLNVGAGGGLVAGRDLRGTLYGVVSFVQLVHHWGKRSVAVRHANVRDWPFLPVRWVHLYLPGRDQLPFARRYMRDFLLRHKFNGIVLEVGGGMRLERHPGISVAWERTVREWQAHGETMAKLAEGIPLGSARRFAASLHRGVGGGSYVEKDDVRRLAEWAEEYGLEIVPEIQSLSHAYYIASARRDLAEDPDMDWPDSYCPSNPESYRVLFDVMDEYLDVLRPRRVHIGHDEWRAGAFCRRCRGKDTGELFAGDVLKIHERLRSKGIETWMWGDHFVDGHNRFGKRWSEGRVVRYERPDTSAARERIAAATREIRILNWSGDEGDATFRKLGWDFIVGNLAGTAERDWPARVARSGLRGGEVSSWGDWEEYHLGKLQVPEALYSAGLLWSAAQPAREDALEQAALRLPSVRGLLAAPPIPSYAAHPMRFETLDLASAVNHAPKGNGWDLSGLVPGDRYYGGVPFALLDPGRRGGHSAVVVARRAEDGATRAALPITGRWASLIFFQAATGEGRPTIHAGDQTHVPRESSELLGFYEIRWADELVATHEIRYEETVGRWDAGLAGLYYFTRPVVAGRLPAGGKAVLWASEWTNPRPDVPIASVTLVGAPGPSEARPALFALTAVEKPRVEDYR